MKYITILLCIALFSLQGKAQDIYIMGEDFETNSESFILYDSGGENGNYSNDEDFVFKIITGGLYYQLLIEEMDTESATYDQFNIYAGNPEDSLVFSNEAPFFLTPITLSSDTISITWHSDVAVNYPGFKIIGEKIGFGQTFSINMISPTPDANYLYYNNPQSNTFKVLPEFGQVIFDGQSAEYLLYHWQVFYEDVELYNIQGQGLNEVNFQFQNQGIYTLEASATDSTGEHWSNTIYNIIVIDEDPYYETINFPDTICSAQVIEIEIPNQHHPHDSLSKSNSFLQDDTLYLYDEIETVLTQEIQAFNQYIENPEDIKLIHLKLEHSYINDLLLTIECPNGQSTTLFENPCSGSYFGFPIDNLEFDSIGIMQDYYWSENSNLFITDSCPDSPGSRHKINPATYYPEEGFSPLVGCPITGTWKLIIFDQFMADNGYMSKADIVFDEEIVINEQYSSGYTENQINASHTWDGENIIEQSGGSMIALPLTSGSHTYSLTTVSNSSYSYTQDFSVYVRPESDTLCCINLFAGLNKTICGLDTELHAATNNADYVLWELIQGPGDVTIDTPNNATTNLSVSEFGEYLLVCHATNTYSACSISDSIIITCQESEETPTFHAEIQNNPSNVTLYYDGNIPDYAEFNWIYEGAEYLSGTGPGPINIHFNNAGTHTIGLCTNYACESDTSFLYIEIEETTEPNLTISHPSCFGWNDGYILVEIPDSSVLFNIYLDSINYQDTITNLEAGHYTINVLTSQEQTFTYEIEIENPQIPDANFFEQDVYFVCTPDALHFELPNNFTNILWSDNSSVSNYTPTDFGLLYFEALNAQSCLTTDTCTIIPYSTNIMAIELAGWLSDDEFVVLWDTTYSDAYQNNRVYAWDGENPPYMLGATMPNIGYWTDQIDFHEFDFVYNMSLNICDEEIQSNLHSIPFIFIELNRNNLHLHWQIENPDIFEEVMEIQIKETNESDYHTIALTNINNNEHQITLPQITCQVRVQLQLKEVYTQNDIEIYYLYSNNILFNPDAISAYDLKCDIFPNPFNDKLFLTLGEGTGNISIQLSDNNGKQLLSTEKHYDGNILVLDFSELQITPGLYSLKIKKDRQVFIKTLIKN